MTDPEEDAIKGTKQIAIDLVGEVEAHHIQYHTVSEREQELIIGFAKAVKEAIGMIEIGER